MKEKLNICMELQTMETNLQTGKLTRNSGKYDQSKHSENVTKT